MGKQELTLGSLFSGSGGFELAATRCGFRALWNSEIEPLPMLVTKKNFPDTKQLGDINFIDGAKVEPVTVLSGGSPCQDMSIAGQRAGLDGSRSGLFREQIRIIKEMRKRDEADGRTAKYVRPRFMVWENVPGAFSSNGGEDFRSVLQEIANVTDEGAVVPRPENGRWENAGCIVGSNPGGAYSVAWRVFDAQYWGVPQRRRRIYLVADFGGLTAPEILFVRQGLSGDFKAGGQAGEGTADSASDGARETGSGESAELTPKTLKIRSGCEGGGKGALVQDDKSATLATHNDQTLFVPTQPVAVENHPADSRIDIAKDGKIQTLTSRMGTGGMNVPLILDDQGGQVINVSDDGISPTLRAEMHGHPPNVVEGEAMGIDTRHPCDIVRITEEKVPTIASRDYKGGVNVLQPIPISDQATRCNNGGEGRNDDGKGNGLGVGEPGAPANTLTAGDRHAVAYAIDRAAFNQGQNAQFGISIEEECAQTLVAKGPNGVAVPKAMTYDCRNGGLSEELSGTLQAKDNGGYSLNFQNPVIAPEKSGTLTAKMAKGTGGPAGDECQNLVAVDYVIRRLTPLECCRLQGFPDDWTDDLAIKNPTSAQVKEWMIAWAEWWRTTGRSEGIRLPKDREQVKRWLADPVSDSALYKMWGNGIALPCAMYVFEGIAEVLNRENEGEKE